MGLRPPRAPRRGEIFSIDPNPVAGREMRDRHYWIVLTPEQVNVHGVAMLVVVSTAATGARAAGLTVRVEAAGVTGVAVCTHVRSFDLTARIQDGSATRVGTAPPDVVDEIAARIASLIEPPPTPAAPPEPKRPPRAEPAESKAPAGPRRLRRGR